MAEAASAAVSSPVAAAVSSPSPSSLSDAEGELALSQQEEFSEETLKRINAAGVNFEEFARSRRWGIGNIHTLEKYIRHLFVVRRLAPTTVSSTLSELLSYLARPPSKVRWTKEELAPIYSYIKTKLKNHAKKQAKTLTPENVLAFCRTAPNTFILLRSKIILIIGIFTLARSAELAALRWDDIKESEQFSGYEVELKRRKTDRSRRVQHLLVPSDAFGTDFRALFNEYRSSRSGTSLVFTSKDGEGLAASTIGEACRRAAIFLELPDADLYTGHGLRSSGAIQLATNGATNVEIMMYGNWTSEAAARGYLRESPAAAAKAAAMINGQSALVTSSTAPSAAPQPSANISPITAIEAHPGTHIFTNCTFQNCTFTVQTSGKL